MLYYNVTDEWAYKRRQEEKAERQAQRDAPSQRLTDAQREYNANLRLAFVNALSAAGLHAYFLERCKASSTPRAVYLEMCAELGVEVAELDPV